MGIFGFLVLIVGGALAIGAVALVVVLVLRERDRG
jgi:hypothetical protein